MFGLKEKFEKGNKGTGSSSDNVSLASPSNPSVDGYNDEEFLGAYLSRSSPFHIPSPTNSASGMVGEGDGPMLRSPHTSHLPSPIHRSFGTHQLNCTGIETPPSSSTHPEYEAFLADTEKDAMSDDKLDKHYSLQQELLLQEKIAEMKESEARKLLAKVLVDNLGLRQELVNREKKIGSYKGQMMAILDWKIGKEIDAECNNNRSLMESKQRPVSAPSSPAYQTSTPVYRTSKGRIRSNIGLSDNTTKAGDSEDDGNTCTEESEEVTQLQTIKGVRVVEEVYGIRRSLSFIQEFASSIDVDQELLKNRIKGGAYLTNQLLIGGLSGWMTALFFRKFGKIAFSAAGGGLLLLVYSARQGYVNINYDSIYQELSKLCDDPEKFNTSGEDDSEPETTYELDTPSRLLRRSGAVVGKSKSKFYPTSSPPDPSSVIDKVKTVKKWVSSHTYTVGGFVLTFVYNIL